MQRSTWILVLGAALASAGCGGDDPEIDGGTNDSGGVETDGGGGEIDGGGGETDGGGGGTDGGTPATGWVLHAHPCVGNRTDALWVDDDGTIYVGCGSTTEGRGIFRSTDGGVTWAAPATTPTNLFASWRVLDISRSANGLLYVAGIDTGSSQRVVSADTSSATWALESVYTAGTVVGSAFTVGTFRRDSTGRAAAESLNGTDVQARPNDTAAWNDVSDWGAAFGGLQILDMEIYEDRLYGCGSTIAAPPYLYLPTTGTAFDFEVVQLATGLGEYDGEMWSIDVDAGGIVVGGVDQDRDAGWIYALDHDSTAMRSFDVASIYTSDPTWVRGVCRNGTTLVAVGELTIRSDGFVFISRDNGSTWSEITPELTAPANYPSAHECWLLDDGTLYTAGAAGTFAVLPPS